MQWFSTVADHIQSTAKQAYAYLASAQEPPAEPDTIDVAKLSATLIRATAVEHDHNHDRVTSAAESARSEIGKLVGAATLLHIRSEQPISTQQFSMRVLPTDRAERAAGIALPNPPQLVQKSFVIADRVVAPASQVPEAEPLRGQGLVGWLRNLVPHRMEAVRLSDLCEATPELACTPLPKGKVLVHAGPPSRT